MTDPKRPTRPLAGKQASINSLAMPLVDRMLHDRNALRIGVETLPGGTRIIDAGIACPGGLEAGRRVAEICMGGLGEVQLLTGSGHWPIQASVGSRHPVLACLICDLADPWNPVYVGQTPGSYIHDGYVSNDTLWAGHIYDGYFAAYDCSNKANPIELNTQGTPGAFTHNSWLNDAGNVLFTTDEVNNSFLGSYDVSDVSNIKLLDTYQTAPGSGAIVHNTHTVNDYEVVSWYTEGVVIVDGARPSNFIEVGKYDSSPISAPGFNGDWGVYPFLPSGNLLLTDMEEGLIVVTPTYKRACYLEGIVTDSTSGNPINGATVQVLGKSITTLSNATGHYKTGNVDSGTYDVQVSAFGYNTKIITGVVLSNGVLTNLNVELSSGVTITLTGNIFYNLNSSAIPNAKIRFTSGPNVIDATTDVNGNYTINNFVPGVYEVNIQNWGYQPYCQQNVNLVTAPFTQGLDFGIYEDFLLSIGAGAPLVML